MDLFQYLNWCLKVVKGERKVERNEGRESVCGFCFCTLYFDFPSLHIWWVFPILFMFIVIGDTSPEVWSETVDLCYGLWTLLHVGPYLWPWLRGITRSNIKKVKTIIFLNLILK